MSIANEFADFWTEARTDLGNPVLTFAAAEYACLPSSHKRGVQLDFGGTVGVIQLTLIVQVADFATVPVSGDDLTYGAVDYRVLKVTAPATGQHLEIDVGAMEA